MATWYRFQETYYASSLDEFDNPIPDSGTVRLHLLKFDVEKTTPKGVRLAGGRWVNESSRKRYACPSIEEARQSFLARKRAEIKHLLARVRKVEKALGLMVRRDWEELPAFLEMEDCDG